MKENVSSADVTPGLAEAHPNQTNEVSQTCDVSRSKYKNDETALRDLLNITVLHINTRGIQSKKKSLHEIFINEDVDVGIVSEMNTKNCPKLKGYVSFKNLVDKKFHGVSIFVEESLAPSKMRIHDMKWSTSELAVSLRA